MKTIQKVVLFYLLILPFVSAAETKEIPFSLDDRDRIIRTEQKLESVKIEMTTRFESVERRFESVDKQFKAVDQRFDAMDKRFDQLFNFLWAFIGIFTTMLVSILGFAFWDRKLSLAPIKLENLKTLNALREYAEHQPKLREILKNAGLL
jgi:hypothetical protein